MATCHKGIFSHFFATPYGTCTCACPTTTTFLSPPSSWFNPCRTSFLARCRSRSSPTAPRIIDVRTRAEYAAGHIPGALNASFLPPWSWSSRVEPLLQGVDPGTELYVICLSAHRSIGALKWLNERGFGNVKQLKGGMQAWRSQRLTEVKEDVAANQEAAPACSGCPGRQTSGEEGTCKPCCTAES
ncbi:hypothetical protein Vretimale_11615 [Volvox reticuliferus]|uniref:Rhodanese domain-containing protein n=1 Tax=Volvox reticuliferus TaxID=1737510 RepID=A0A8J4LRY1_9CHLO|nr:hypothetical protein Vretimale_11615 [Volvox reticuliferus]